MTKELKSLLERVARWPQKVQEEAVETLRSIEAGHTGRYVLTSEDKEALARSADDVKHARFVSSRKVAAFFKRAGA
jgi:hypothetical protein